jgi:hypothetical protein
MNNQQQLQNDIAYYWGVCILKKLRDNGLISETEYRRICDISAGHYGTDLICT